MNTNDYPDSDVGCHQCGVKVVVAYQVTSTVPALATLLCSSCFFHVGAHLRNLGPAARVAHWRSLPIAVLNPIIQVGVGYVEGMWIVRLVWLCSIIFRVCNNLYSQSVHMFPNALYASNKLIIMHKFCCLQALHAMQPIGYTNIPVQLHLVFPSPTCFLHADSPEASAVMESFSIDTILKELTRAHLQDSTVFADTARNHMSNSLSARFQQIPDGTGYAAALAKFLSDNWKQMYIQITMELLFTAHSVGVITSLWKPLVLRLIRTFPEMDWREKIAGIPRHSILVGGVCT
jgi:hypothetical protein